MPTSILVDDLHLQVLKDALDMYVRAGLGNFRAVADIAVGLRHPEPQIDRYHQVVDLTTHAGYAFNDRVGGGPGIMNREHVDDRVRVAADLHDLLTTGTVAHPRASHPIAQINKEAP